MEELKKFREQTPLDVTVTKSIAQLQLGEKKVSSLVPITLSLAIQKLMNTKHFLDM